MIVKKILIFNPSFIGDAVLTTPLLKICKDYFTNVQIHFCVRYGYEKLFIGLPFIDRIISFDKRAADKGIKGIFKLRQIIKEQKYEFIICPHRSMRSALIVNLNKAQVTVGFGGTAFSFLFKKRVPRNLQLHEVYRNLQLLKPLMEDDFGNVIKSVDKLYVAENKKYYGKFKYFTDVIKDSSKLVGIQATSNWKTKMWPLERFAALINKLYEYDIISVLFSSAKELNIIENMSQYINVPFINLAGLLELDELSSAIKNMDLFITNDTGPMHIAAAHKIPVVAIFGPTVPEFGFAPFGCTHKIIEDPTLDCRPCSLHGGNRCPKKHFKCMLNLTIDRVLENALDLLNR
jgi:heptosyltransferase-2